MGHPNDNMQLDHTWQFEALEESGDISRARFILNRMFQDFRGAFAIRLWNNSMLYIGEGSPAFTFCLEQASIVRDMVLSGDPMRLAAAYFDGDIHILGDFNAAMRLLYHFEALSLPWHEKMGLVFRALMLADLEDEDATVPAYSGSAELLSDVPTAMTLDYEMPADFYRNWLDEQMLHACAYFGDARQPLAQAQHNQLDLVCLKLHLQHGDHVLDIGGDWGAFACWAARHYGAYVHSITSSPVQYAYIVEEVKKQRLQKQVSVELCHYQDLPENRPYDKAINMTMRNHVGQQHLPAYLAKVHAILKPGGLFLHHGVTSESAAWQHEMSTEFINQQIFPDGALPSLPHLQQTMQAAKFEIFNVEGLRRHQALTLRRWTEKLEQHHLQLATMAGERTYRLWRLYMTACAIQFEQGVNGIHQILAVRR